MKYIKNYKDTYDYNAIIRFRQDVPDEDGKYYLIMAMQGPDRGAIGNYSIIYYVNFMPA